jgi:hypothetical protein
VDLINRSALGALPPSRDAVFEVVRPFVRILRSCGTPSRSIRSATERACRQYARNLSRAVSLDHVPFLKLAEILMVWARDPEFIDETGSPMKLLLGGGRRSFENLLKKARVSTDARFVLEQLEMLGSVRRRGRRVRLVSNVLLSVKGKQLVAGPLLNSIREFLETIEHNLHQSPGSLEGRMHRLASCESLDPAQFAEVQRFVRVGGQAFLDSLDEKLESCKARSGRGLHYGAGIYVVVQKPEALSKQRLALPPTRSLARTRQQGAIKDRRSTTSVPACEAIPEKTKRRQEIPPSRITNGKVTVWVK